MVRTATYGTYNNQHTSIGDIILHGHAGFHSLSNTRQNTQWSVFLYKLLKYIVGFALVEMDISTNLKPIVLGPDQNLVPIGVTKLYCVFQLDTYMRGLKMYDGLSRTVA